LELGPDALRISRKDLRDILGESSRPVKALLLDQRAIAGLGNIYVDESLFRAGIHPAERSCDIDGKRVGRLHRTLRDVLAKAIACGGSSVRTYRTSSGSPGTYQKHHRVYGRKGEDCPVCGSVISYAKVASRGTHYCPDCQPPPRKKKGKSGKKRSRRRPA
jgi:formamidopyrimidine-DNA glycosylase